MWPCGLVAMIPALGAGGPGFKSRLGPKFCHFAQPWQALPTLLQSNLLTFRIHTTRGFGVLGFWGFVGK